VVLVSGISKPSVGLKKDGGAKIFLAVPPIRRARRRAAGAENAFVEAVELLAIGWRLAVFLALRGVSGVNIGVA
jgi:hypothetical protein